MSSVLSSSNWYSSSRLRLRFPSNSPLDSCLYIPSLGPKGGHWGFRVLLAGLILMAYSDKLVGVCYGGSLLASSHCPPANHSAPDSLSIISARAPSESESRAYGFAISPSCTLTPSSP